MEVLQETTQLPELLVVSPMEDHQESNIQALQEPDHQALAVRLAAQSAAQSAVQLAVQ